MNKPIGAIDCDDTAGEFTMRFIDHINQQDGTEYGLESVVDHDLSVGFGGSMEHDWYPRILQFAEVERLDNPIVPMPGAVRAIGRLAVKYELVIITARPAEQLDIVKTFVDTYLSNYVSDVIARNGQHNQFDKGEVMEHINADFLVDDHHIHVANAIKRGRRGVLFGTLPKTIAQKEAYPYASDWHAVYETITGQSFAER